LAKSPDDLPSQDTYALVAPAAEPVAAPDLPYAPPMPRDRSFGIGLIGAGGISAAHLAAYKKFGLNVVAICDRHIERAEARRDVYFPNARTTDKVEDVIGQHDVEVLDLTVQAEDRLELMRRGLAAGHHVLSQKPFVHDLRTGRELVELAETKGLQLAVNQNGRWAPHLSWMREAVFAGLVGDVTAVHVAIQWDHTWIAGTPFATMPWVILEDFAVHWFDFLVSIIGDRAERILAIASRANGQPVEPPLLAHVQVTYPGGHASLSFDGNAKFGAADTTVIVGTEGTLRSTGPDLGHQSVSLATAAGLAQPALAGEWFVDGFAGTMGALLSAIESGKAPINSARGNLVALGLCQAAIESAVGAGPISLR